MQWLITLMCWQEFEHIRELIGKLQCGLTMCCILMSLLACHQMGCNVQCSNMQHVLQQAHVLRSARSEMSGRT